MQVKKTSFLGFLLFAFFYGLWGCTQESRDTSVRNDEDIVCGAGKYLLMTGSPQCAPVEEGYVSPEGSNFPIRCIGKQAPNETKTVCVDCSVSFHVNASNSRCDSNFITCENRVLNGSGFQTWNPIQSQYSACAITGCDAGFYENGGQCVAVKDHQISGLGDMSVSACTENAVPNLVGDACVTCSDLSHVRADNSRCDSNIIACEDGVVNGSGIQIWDPHQSQYGACVITGCNAGFYEEGGQCIAVSGNKFSKAGDTSFSECQGIELPNKSKDGCIPCPTTDSESDEGGISFGPSEDYTSCICPAGSGNCGSTIVNVTLMEGEPKEISAINASSYSLEGACSEIDQPVQVTFNTGQSDEIQKSVNCDFYRWKIVLDLTTLKTSPVTLQIEHKKSGQASGATISKGSLAHSFRCPRNYISVPKLAGYTVRDFCISKWEQALANKKKPHTSVTPSTARSNCKNLTSQVAGSFDLISNDQWQTLARNIEGVSKNWKDNTPGTQLNQGLIIPQKGEILSASSLNPLPSSEQEKNNPCFKTNVTCDFNTWHEKRRTHELNNGEVIWDLSGGVAEWVREKFARTSNNYKNNNYISSITDSTYQKKSGVPLTNVLFGGSDHFRKGRTAKELFGPARDYGSLLNPYGGLGYARFINSFNRTSTVISRGGYNQAPYNKDVALFQHGIFSVDRTRSDSQPMIGYRCAFNPEVISDLCKDALDTGSVSGQPGDSCDPSNRVYYDSIQDKCLGFTYLGCQGNANNFYTEQECLQACKK